ncbi:MAG: hypothetical protein A2Y10_01025 [Planctomycetes bacterium GWF2_41_51]|nr:MAG: hypothetical protein A2Y10_01025 [Planctomycetes bacterium GWF2_41_51]HBG26528.1 hypothetical protein [Phycisphaerales bacterium]
MKKVIVVLSVMFFTVLTAYADDLVRNWHFEDEPNGTGWTLYGNQANYYNLADANYDNHEKICSLGWTSGTCIYQNTGIVTQPDTNYLMKVRVRNGDGKIDGLNLRMWAGNPPEMYSGEMFLYYGHPDYGPWQWEEFTMSLNSADYPNMVGNTLGVALYLVDYVDPWGQYGWLYIDYISLLPNKLAIVDQPDAIVVDEIGSTAQFRCGVASQSIVHYQWYKSTDAIADGGDTAIGTDSENLGFAVQASDIGKFVYCVVANEDFPAAPVTSRIVLLERERLLGHWTFDNTLNDASGNGFNGSWASPVYVSGISNQAIQTVRDIASTNRVEISNSSNAFNFYSSGLTVSAWIKTSEPNQMGIAGKESTTPWKGWEMYTRTNGTAAFGFKEGGVANGTTVVNDGQWHLITGTYDGAAKTAKLYVDGALDVTGTITGTPTGDANNVIIGGLGLLNNNPFGGMIDDVRIFTYPLSNKAVLDIYNDFIEPDKSLCLNEFDSRFDADGNCKIEMIDLAEFAKHWLSCGRHPVTACQ